MSKCKAESVVGYRLREFPGQTPLLLFTSLTFRVGGCGTCKDVQYTSSCRPKRRGEIGAEGSITHSCRLCVCGFVVVVVCLWLCVCGCVSIVVSLWVRVCCYVCGCVCCCVCGCGCGCVFVVVFVAVCLWLCVCIVFVVVCLKHTICHSICHSIWQSI